ncbi:hypothetical protein NQ317_011360 [Molorchus minor]|uniref:Uncharacterized protein n=1 Tax=Molorchus minor TaxID=1323400 RepID=A0ABQ9JCK8_9CUCU|nr:hypothetical protein NQ317_011360 [Molorchus minor]
MYYPSIPPVHSFSIIKTIVTIPLRIMENSVPSQLVDTLINRLNEAERRAKLLNLEVKSIRREISELQQTATSVSTTQNRNVDPLLRLTLGSTNLGRHNPRHTILLDSLPGTSAVDSSETGKRPVDTDNSTQNKS